jgi:hypothetical protein
MRTIIMTAMALTLTTGLTLAQGYNTGGAGKKESPTETYTREQNEKLPSNMNAPKGGTVDMPRVGAPNSSTLNKPAPKK